MTSSAASDLSGQVAGGDRPAPERELDQPQALLAAGEVDGELLEGGAQVGADGVRAEVDLGADLP